MRIIHKLDDFLFTIFPDAKEHTESSLISELESFYSFGSFKPTVRIEDGWVTLDEFNERIDKSLLDSKNDRLTENINLREEIQEWS